MNVPDSQPDAGILRAKQILGEKFGHKDFLPGQEAALSSIIKGRDLLVVMPTGSGKSLLYQLPALMDDGITIVVSPLISLMKDQVDELQRKNIPASFVNSSLSVDEQRSRIEQCAEGKIRLLYVAPERFQNSSFIKSLSGMKVARMAVDEAHCISEWGHDFRPDYLRLKHFLKHMNMPRITALTATATVRVQRDIIESLGLKRDEVDVHVQGFDRPNLVLSVVSAFSDEEKDAFLVDYLAKNKGSGIIYTGTRKTADAVAMALKISKTRAGVYHAGMDPEARSAAQDSFLGGRDRVVVATSAFGMGIDKPDVRFVVHYNYPGSIEQYYQEIGRAGRDGLKSECILLFSPSDHFLREFFIDLNYPDAETVETVLDALWEIKQNPIMLTYKQIADFCMEKVKDGQVGAAVRLLDGAGVTKALSGGPMVTITLEKPASETLAGIRGPLQKRVLEALATAADIEIPGRHEVSLEHICVASGLGEDQVRRTLTSMDHAGELKYEHAFRGRGIVKLTDSPPLFSKISIDWKKQKELRRVEEEKLDAMEKYIDSTGCRRDYILKYFGEIKSFQCGTCDNCGKIEPTGDSRGILALYPNEVRSIISCIENLRFPLGKTKITEIVTGARTKNIMAWNLDRNPSYDSVRVDRETVKEIIDFLTREGYLKQEGDRGRPVLSVTGRGGKIMQRAPVNTDKEVEQKASDPERKQEGGPLVDPFKSSCGDSIAEAADRMIRELLVAEPESAKALLPELRILDPRWMAGRLVMYFDMSKDSRVRARVVWAVGELCGRHGLAFLTSRASSEESNIRRLAASAMGKAAASINVEPDGIADELENARLVLTELTKDSVLQVRQYAEKSLKQFNSK